jgi:phage tail protein X
MMIRQGDILLRPIPAPTEVTEVGTPVSRLVLAVGEATGHAHEVIADDESILAATAGGRALLHILRDGVAITHPDHDPVPRPVPPRWYEIVRQRVYTPAQPRPVAD